MDSTSDKGLGCLIPAQITPEVEVLGDLLIVLSICDKKHLPILQGIVQSLLNQI
ncbi:MAG: hypothetical protein ABSA23_11365 [Anaerolineales bacterium]|jgi:hypothetical protein